MKRDILTITSSASNKIKELLKQKSEAKAIRVAMKSGGCSGLKYVIEYAKDLRPYEEVISATDYKVFIDPKAIIYIIGSKMDFVEDTFKSGFVFINPNEKESCGCGKSFNV